MTWHHIVFFISIIITAAVMGYISWYSRLQRKSVAGAGVYMWVALLVSLLSIFQGLSMIGSTEEWAFFWFNIRIACFAAIPVLWLVFILHYVGKSDLLSKPRIALLFVIPIITQVMLWTNDMHGLWVVHEVGFHQAGPFFIPETAARIPGAWFMVHNLYAYGMMLAGVVILAAMSVRIHRQYRGQVVALCIGTLVMIIGSLIPTLNFVPGMELNPLPQSFALGSLIIAWGLYRHRFLGATPLFNPEKRISVFLIALFLLMTAGILIAGFVYYRQYREHYRAGVDHQLSSITESKVNELVQWRKERLSNAAMLHRNASFAALVQRYFADPTDANARWHIQIWMNKYAMYTDYVQIFLTDTNGVIRMSAPEGLPPKVIPHLARDIAITLSTGRIDFQDFHRDSPDGPIYLAIMIPIIDEQNGRSPLGLIALKIDPEKYLYPMINRWPVPSQTAETLIVRRDGNDILFLNELKFMKNAALNLRIPLKQTYIAAVMAVLGQEGVVEGIDYRGVPVIAALRAVPDSPWHMITRMDAEEVYGPMRGRFGAMVIVILGLLAGTGSGMAALWRRQDRYFIRERLKAAEALQESEEIFRHFMEHSPVYVFFKDLQIRTLRLSKNYEIMLGKPIGELLGKTMDELFPSDFAKKMIADDLKVLKEGKQVEIEEELNGRIYTTMKFPILQDGKPRYLAGFTIDITERKKAEETLIHQLDELRRWQEVIIEREGRVIELKKAVNDLLRELGRPEKYSD
jgi:PAS domain S-box-containing protein